MLRRSKSFHHYKKVILDTILGDNGKKYSGTKNEQITYYRELLKYADIITPNLTEAMLLSDYDVGYDDIKKEDIEKIAIILKDLGAKEVIIKGFEKDNKLNTLYYNGKFMWFEIDKIPIRICGTGDAFSSLVTISVLKGEKLEYSISKIMELLYNSIKSQKLHDKLNEISTADLSMNR